MSNSFILGWFKNSKTDPIEPRGKHPERKEMGNKQSSKRRESQLVRSNLASSVNPALPQEAIVALTGCLNRLPLVLNKSVREEVIRRVELMETGEAPEILLSKGQEPPGIYVLVSGSVTVFSENKKFALREIQVGNCFGEVSALFNMNCTADVWSCNRLVLIQNDLNIQISVLILLAVSHKFRTI